MAYTKVLWQNSPSTDTPINAENLNHMDDQIALNDQRLTDLEGAHVSSFNGRTGAVAPADGDYDIGQIAPLTGAQVGQVPVVTNIGTEEAPELVFRMGAGGGAGGHEIIDAEGNTMPQESAMQFPDSHVSDDSVNGITVVENIKEVLPADYDSTTDEGIIVTDDGNDVPIGEIEEDVVGVTADGVKTYATLLNEIAGDTDFSKVSDSAYLTSESVSGAKNVFVVRAHANSYATFFHGTSENAGSKIRTYHITPNGSLYEESVGTSYSDKSTDKPSNGTKLTLYYGTSSTVINLKTSANYCMMSDGETSVESYISSLGNHKAEYITLGKGWKGYAYAFVPMLNANKYTITITEAIVYGGSQSPIDITNSVSVGNKTRDGFNIEMSSNTYVGECVRLSFTVS